MRINARYQRADFASTELGEYDVNRALKLYNDADWWVEQRTLREELTHNKQENCPPGIGFHTAEGDSFIHICQLEPDDNRIFYKRTITKKVFGLFNSKEEGRHQKEHLTDARIRQIIKWFFENNLDALGLEFGS